MDEWLSNSKTNRFGTDGSIDRWMDVQRVNECTEGYEMVMG